ADMVDAHLGVIAPHSAQGPICSAACVQLNASLPNFFIHEIFDEFNEPWEKQIVTYPVEVVDGYIEVSERPGLGIDLNIEEILKHPYQQENYLPLFKPGWELRRTQSSENLGTAFEPTVPSVVVMFYPGVSPSRYCTVNEILRLEASWESLGFRSFCAA